MVEKYVLAKPLVMVGLFLVAVALPLLYEVVTYLRAKPRETAAPQPAPPPRRARKR